MPFPSRIRRLEAGVDQHSNALMKLGGAIFGATAIYAMYLVYIDPGAGGRVEPWQGALVIAGEIGGPLLFLIGFLSWCRERREARPSPEGSESPTFARRFLEYLADSHAAGSRSTSRSQPTATSTTQPAATSTTQPTATDPPQQTAMSDNQPTDRRRSPAKRPTRSQPSRPDPASAEYLTRTDDRDFDDLIRMYACRQATVRPIERLLGINQRTIDGRTPAERKGLSPTTSVLLYGPPGNGKTHFAKCLAGEFGLAYFHIGAGELNDWRMNASSQNVRELFEEVRAFAPSLVFIDEIDLLAPSRAEPNQHQNTRQTTGVLFNQVSELHDDDVPVFLLAATNKREDLDAALLRGKRFDSQIEVERPGREERWELLGHHLQPAAVALTDLEAHQSTICDALEGATRASVATVGERAREYSAGREEVTGERDLIDAQDVLTAIDEVKSEVATW